jgi:TPR repeat protein
MEALRKPGVLQACPLCRTDLPDGPEKLFEEASRVHVLIIRKVESGRTALQLLTDSEQQILTKVMSMLTTAAKQGLADAQRGLGAMYFHGHGVAEDLEEAARWTQKAENQGGADAQCSLGIMYHGGTGVSQDFEEAAHWFQKAAGQGHLIALFNPGASYRDGK